MTDAHRAQREEVARWVTQWRACALSTAPLDANAAKDAVHAAYRCAGLSPPRQVHIANGPISGTLAATMLHGGKTHAVHAALSCEKPTRMLSQVFGTVWGHNVVPAETPGLDAVGDALIQGSARVSTAVAVGWDTAKRLWRDQRGRTVGSGVLQAARQEWNRVQEDLEALEVTAAAVADALIANAGVRASAGSTERAHRSVREQVREGALAKASVLVEDRVPAPLRRYMRDVVATPLQRLTAHILPAHGRLEEALPFQVAFGGLDVDRVAYLLAFARFMELRELDGLLEGLRDAALHCGWWMPYQEHVVVCARPSVLSLDEADMLHARGGPALVYRDGFEVHAWHGVQVPRRFALAPDDVTVEDVDRATNAEVRRVMMEHYGIPNFLRDCGATELARDETGILYRRDGAGGEPLLILRVVNKTPEPDGTFKEYFLRVPPNMARPRQAVAWTFGLEEWEYRPEQES